MMWNREFLTAEEASFWEIGWRGLSIDWVAATWVCLPAWFFLLIGKERVARYVWVIGLSCALALEVIDIGFFPYAHRRSGPELVRMLTFWQDTLPALSKYVRDFLAGFLFWGALVGGMWVFLRAFPVRAFVGRRRRWLGWLGSIGVLVVSARGGFRLKPLLVIDAAIEGCPSCTPFVLNTTFFFVRSLGQPALPPWPALPSQALLYPRRWKADTSYAFAPRYNIVVFILESFSQEYIEEGYAPFLRALLEKGRAIRWGFATNSRSAEGVPAILSSIPSLGEEPVIFTPYASRIQNSLAEILRKWGYATAFFHGGNDGTMVLDSYARQAGFTYYFGRRTYPYPERDYDGTWGIWDGPFLQFCAEKLGALAQPFLGVIFTLSSHHPYAIPKALVDSFPPGPLPIHRSIRYTDWALRQFFARIETTAWAKRTLFVFTADHTGPSQKAYHPARSFHVPIGFYLMEGALPPVDMLASQIDILPSLLEAVGYPDTVPVWGCSVWGNGRERWTPQKPLPFLLQAIGPKYLLQRSSHGELTIYRWEGSPWDTRRDTVLPTWYQDWIAYLASYGAFLEGKATKE